MGKVIKYYLYLNLRHNIVIPNINDKKFAKISTISLIKKPYIIYKTIPHM